MNEIIPLSKILVNVTTTAIGDNVCFLPILKKLHSTDQIIYIFSEGYLADLWRFIFPEHKIVIKPGPDLMIPPTKLPIVNTWIKWPTSIKMHLIDYAAVCMADTILYGEDRNYPLFAPLVENTLCGEKYIVVPLGHTRPSKAISSETVREVVTFAKSKGLKTVFLGRNYDVLMRTDWKQPIGFPEIFEDDSIINMLDKTTVAQVHAILSDARCVVGMDGGIVHMAGLTDIPIVCAYTVKSPEYLMPVRHGQIGWNCKPIVPPETACRFCMSRSLLTWDHDYSKCAAGDWQCQSTIKPEQFIAALEEVL